MNKKNKTRSELKAALRRILGPDWFFRNAEDFYGGGHARGIWTSNENPAPNNRMLYDMERLELNPLVATVIADAGWYAEPHDSGTLMLWPL